MAVVAAKDGSPGKESSLHISRSAERALQLLDAVISNGGLTLGEAAGIVESFQGSKSRKVLVERQEELDAILRKYSSS